MAARTSPPVIAGGEAHALVTTPPGDVVVAVCDGVHGADGGGVYARVHTLRLLADPE